MGQQYVVSKDGLWLDQGGAATGEPQHAELMTLAEAETTAARFGGAIDAAQDWGQPLEEQEEWDTA